MNKIKNPKVTVASQMFDSKKFPTPKKIVEYLDERIVGQEEAKKRLAVAVYNHYKRVMANLSGMGQESDFSDVQIEKSNVLMLGNTGTGKTFLIQSIAKMLDVPCHIHDCTKLTESGYVGDDVENVLTGLLRECNYDVDKAELGIVCLDEIDKLSKKGRNVSITRDVGGEGVQQSLLKIVEGNLVGVMPEGGRKHPQMPQILVDTSNNLFIATGAFVGIEDIVNKRKDVGMKRIGFNNSALSPVEDLDGEESSNVLDEVTPEDLKNFGMIPEFIGRFPVITHTNPLEKEDLMKIITEPKNSVMRQYQKLAFLDGKNLVFSNEAIEVIAEAASLANTGARGLRNIMETVLNDFMFESLETRKKKIVIEGDYCRKALRNILKGDAARLKSA